MKYGYFDAERKEYVVTRPDTPLPWINYLGCEEYCGLISNTAGGYSFYKDPKNLRILRYRYNNIPMDRGGRYLYLKDEKTGDFWSATWQPVPKDLKQYKYECRHGLGYTKISSGYKGIETEAFYLVPLGQNLEIWMVDIRNTSKSAKELTLFSFVEFCLWDALNDMTDYQYNLNIGETEYKAGIIYHLSRYRVDQSYFAYFACAKGRVKSFDSDRDAFLGPYGSLEAPQALKKGEGSDSIARGWAPVGSHCISLKLKPGEKETLIFVLGYSENKGEEKNLVKKYASAEAIFQELDKLKVYWEENLNKFSVETPDPEVNIMVNIWNQYQCRTTFNWSRSASYYEAGIGRGMGFRDSNQDTLGFVHQIPIKVKHRIVDLASNQHERGDAYHQYSPLTKEGREEGCSDDHLWLIFSTASYLKETGDLSFLEEKIPFSSGKKAKLYEHLRQAIDYSLKHVGPHGLPLIGFADWNDCLNLTHEKKQAESVMVAQMLSAVALEMSKLAEVSGRKRDIPKYKKIARDMAKKINTKAWDALPDGRQGEWYIRAFDDNKKPVGSSKCKEGKIFLETQGWAVISGVAPRDRAKLCMDSVRRWLATPYGIILQQPAYKDFHPELGGVSVYPPGLKENAGIFCHPNPWAVMAECILGRGDIAFQYYKAILPAAKNSMAEIHRVEPYVYCQMIAGRDHPKFGEGKNSWLTGSAAWNFVAISQWILGIRPDYDGLLVDPCIPKKWKGFTVKRHFRNADYYITVRNPQSVNKGIKRVVVDGGKIKGNLLPVFDDGEEHFVEVIMG